MSRLVSSAENWEKVYSALQNINFAAFDYGTVKQSLLDYVKLYFPETFNDFIESSEFVAIVETFAYVAELVAYRTDLTVHENFITTAQRQDSILRLAKHISYTATRSVPARGLVKITSVSTTESVIDSNGANLANRVVRWNDTSNSNWKDQFITIMNRTFAQNFGTVSPADRFQIQNVLFELYAVNTNPMATGVFPYSTTVDGRPVSMELVPVAYDATTGIIERRPTNNANFTFLYGQDGLGDASDTTGFFSYTKQGSLQRLRTAFDGITPNQTYTIAINNINDTDVWVNNVDPVTGAVLNIQSTLPYKPATFAGKSGEWVEVDVAAAQNVIFNTNPIRTKYELETLATNQVRILFGDSEFSDIPAGSFDIWIRTSLNLDLIIPQSAIVNTRSSFTYLDLRGQTQTLTFTFSLINSLQNASSAETIEHVRATAPAVYYSQDRMVNGQDYNSFMLQDPSILKLRAINRTFAGDSKYMVWHDASGTYEDVKTFSDDGMIYFEPINTMLTTPPIDINTLISTYVEPILSSTDLLIPMATAGVTAQRFRNILNATEKTRLGAALFPAPAIVDMYYNLVTYDWFSVKRSTGPTGLVGWPSAYIIIPLITIVQPSIFATSYNVSRLSTRLVFQSPTTAFWSTNNAASIVNYNTLNSSYDEIAVLQANTNYNRTNVLSSTWRFSVLGQEVVESGPNTGLPDTARLSILPTDTANTGSPPGLNINNSATPTGLAEIIKPKYTQIVPSSLSVTLPLYYVVGRGDITVSDINGVPLLFNTDWSEDSTRTVSNVINFSSSQSLTTVAIDINEYVYLTRLTANDPWVAAPTKTESINSYVIDQEVFSTTIPFAGLWQRFVGRSSLNFMWTHHTPMHHLVDPSPSNIVDSFIITKGYYLSLKLWLENPLAPAPTLPTPLDLRTSYAYLLNNKMISDSLILQPGVVKLLFGPKADSALQANFVVIKTLHSTLTDNQIKTSIVVAIRNFFDITHWEFGETFYATELFTAIHTTLPADISSVVLVPTNTTNRFGSMFQVVAGENEIFYPDIGVANIQLVTGYTTTNLNI